MASDEKNLFVFLFVFVYLSICLSCIMWKDLALSITTSIPLFVGNSCPPLPTFYLAKNKSTQIRLCIYLFSVAAREIANSIAETKRKDKERKNTNQKQIRAIHYRMDHESTVSTHCPLQHISPFRYVFFTSSTTLQNNDYFRPANSFCSFVIFKDNAET